MHLWSHLRILLNRGQPAAPRAGGRTASRPECQPTRAEWRPDAVPPLGLAGLHRMEDRAFDAHPVQLRRWICEIDEQLGLMSPADRGHAQALRLKLERLLDTPRTPYRHRG